MERYREVMDAYQSGLHQAREAGRDPADIHSVASFFVSRVGTEVDHRLNAIGTNEARVLKGEAAIANARLGYQAHERTLAEPRWQRLATAGGRVQRPLWASTGVKDSSYPDTMYVRHAGARRADQVGGRLEGARRIRAAETHVEAVNTNRTETNAADDTEKARLLAIYLNDHYAGATGGLELFSAGRLKPNGHILTRSPLSDLPETESMLLGVQGKAACWRTLRILAESEERLPADRLNTLLERAQQQSDTLEELRSAAASRTLLPRPAGTR